MKRVWKFIEVIVFLFAAAFFGYQLFFGEAEFTVEGFLLLFVLLPIAGFVSLADRRKRRKHVKQVSDRGRGQGEDASGEVRTPAMLRVGVLFVLLVFWAMIPTFSLLLYQDIGVPDDLSILVPFAVSWGILVALTVFAIVFFDTVFAEIQFDSYGVVYRKRFRRHSIHWEEFGVERDMKNRVVFFDRHGRKLFAISAAYEGAREFFLFYKQKTGNIR